MHIMFQIKRCTYKLCNRSKTYVYNVFNNEVICIIYVIESKTYVHNFSHIEVIYIIMLDKRI
jgi:hypothetical protein